MSVASSHGVRSTLPLAILLAPSLALAFIDVEAVRRETGEGFKGKTSLTTSGQSGNTDRVSLNLSTLNLRGFTQDDVFFLGDINYSRSNDVEDTSNGRAHVRYTHLAKRPLAFEVFAQTEYDRFRKLNIRNLSGANLRHRLLHSESSSLFVGTGAFYEWDSLSDGQNHSLVRGNLYASYAGVIATNWSGSATLYYQPSVTAIADYRLRFQASLESSITERLGLQLQTSSDTETVRAEGVKPTDFSYSVGFNLKY